MTPPIEGSTFYSAGSLNAMNDSSSMTPSWNDTPMDATLGLLSSSSSSFGSMQGNVTANDTTDDSDDDFGPPQRVIDTMEFQLIIWLAYALIFLVGITGNILVCYIVYSRKHMQNVTNYFITNLAMADILLCVLAVPFTPLYSFLGKWLFGSVMCRLVASAQGVSVYISSLTLTSIAIDRFIVILYPFRPRMQVSTCLLMIVLIWIFSLVAMAPYSIAVRIRHVSAGGQCPGRMFGIFTVKMQFVVPFVIVSICYMKISLALSTRVRNMSKSRTSRKDEMERERKRKTNRMLIAMVAIFGISWLPMNLVNFISDIFKSAESWPYFQMTFSLSHMLAMSSTCYNPILYAWLNETFRKEFKEVLPCWRSYEDDNGRVSNRLVGRQSLYSKPHHVEDEDEDAGNNATPSHHRHHHNHNNHRHHNHGKGLDEGDADVETGSGHPQPRRKNTEMISVMNPKFGTTTTTITARDSTKGMPT
ncbi:unnamed protein product [Notodromas monacha]|uniref:G-protein coupled receptors family 1 profile domain-containing protein n=1 Tax=Notodromas monacha TaxID=399045 RepID=A0A7R9BSA2_9CRUS|nr:unnamed protein product [Notodromas monacha]CAG0920763.1 unnamed protein product [Notodromas monacha]